MDKLIIPETVEEMQELMRDVKKIGQIIRDGQLEELVAKYSKATDERGAMRDMVTEAVVAGMAGSSAIEDRVKTATEETINKLLKEHGVNRPQLAPPTEAGTGAEANAAYNPLAPGVKMNDVGFANLGDFARTIWHKNPRPDMDRLTKARGVMDAYSSVDPAAGGFLIPETMRAEIMQVALESAIVRPRATVITMTSQTLPIPYVDSTTNVGSVLGGMTFSWTPEGGTLSPTQAKFGRVKLEANKLAGLAAVPNELWADAAGLNSFLMQAIPKGLAFYEDLAFFEGSGAGEPLGFLNSGALIAITKETDQAADTIVVENVLGMYSRMLPTSLGNAIWIANQSCFKELMTLSIQVGVGGAPVSLVDIRNAPLPSMLARPLIISEKVPALGDQGDLCFVDLSYYLLGDRQAVTLETSEHVYFLSDETALRVIERVDGRPWLQGAFTPAHGATVSPFVAIEARA